MKYKKVPRIKEELSMIGIGCWNFGGDWDSSDDRQAERIVDTAIDCGVNLFDVAPVYGWFHAEEVLGSALSGGKRNQVLIASKCGLTWDGNHVTQNNLTKKNLLKEIDGSLGRLKTDYIDIYQLHWPDPRTPIEETADALKEIQKSGKIRYVGLSNFSQKDAAAFMSMIEIHSQQGLYNMLERNTGSYHNIPLEYKTEKEMLQTVRREGQAFFPYSPLFQGLLAGELNKKDNFSSRDIRNENPKLSGRLFLRYYACYEQLQKLADEAGHPMYEIAMNWLRQKPEVTAIIAGVSSPEQIRKNLNCLTWEIDDGLMDRINAVIKDFEDI
ncbi:MAG: aldo/keto reductase [Enterocloster citroniae]|nr:aldo/keto reductase [Enterocloster citroniae]